MVKYEFHWLHYPPGQKGILFLSRADNLADLIENMNETNYPLPQVSKMRKQLEENDAFSYLLDQWHVHKVPKGKQKFNYLTEEPEPKGALPKKEFNSYQFDKKLQTSN